jgi:FixJ family two-component response regulator
VKEKTMIYGQRRMSGEVFLVDDDPAVRDALSVTFRIEGFQARSFADGTAFLEAARQEVPDAILLDVRMPGTSGIDVLEEIEAQSYPAPIFIISGHGDIPMAVEAIKKGAIDFLEKPFDADTIVQRVREAIRAQGRRALADTGFLPRAFPGHERLTRREREVLAEIASGASNKEAGSRLGISPRTIEVHRARIMEKLNARNTADLMRIVLSRSRSV